MEINAQQVKELREKTGAGMMDCKNALTEAKADMEQAIVILRKKGLASAQKKATRIAAEGMIGHYIHAGGKLGVLVEVNCETDFVARNDDFAKFARELAMHIAAMNPENVQTLLQQPFVKEPSKNVQDLLNELVAKIGENILIGRFVRYKLGE